MSKSKLEATFEIALRTHGEDLPPHEREFYFHPVRRWRADFAYPDHKLIVEIDGGQWAPGGGRHNTDKDREKMNELAILGYRVIRFSGSMLNAPEACIAIVRRALALTPSPSPSQETPDPHGHPPT